MKYIIYTLLALTMLLCPVFAIDNLAEPIKISLVNLIANPSKYCNKTIEVCGYYHYEDGIEGGNYLFLTKEYAMIGDRSNSVALPMNVAENTRPKDGTYVRVVGVVGDYDKKSNITKIIYMKSVSRMTAYVLEPSEHPMEAEKGSRSMFDDSSTRTTEATKPAEPTEPTPTNSGTMNPNTPKPKPK